MPLTLIFGVDSNVGILRELVRHGGSLSSSDIQARSGLSKTVVRLGLLSLSQAGVVITEGSANTKLHRFNAEHYFARQIEALYDAEKNRFTEIIESIRCSVEDRLSDIMSLWVYGSVARKADGPGSDLDIGLIASEKCLTAVTETVRENLREPATKLGFSPNVVGLSLKDVSRLEHDADPWWVTMTRDAIVLLGDRPDDVLNRKRTGTFG
jgi:predicted nucleotidyltransferase